MAVRDGAEKRSHGGRAEMKTLCNSRKEGGLVSKEDAEYGKRHSRKAAIDESPEWPLADRQDRTKRWQRHGSDGGPNKRQSS